MTVSLRVLLVADTHLGFDEPTRPRVGRRRRGPDFFRNFERALEPALENKVDLVMHGGDLLYRSRVPVALVERALAPLRRVADRGVPVFLVPGNHERSRLPYPLLASHPRVFVFHQPHTFAIETGGMRVAVSGFPFARRVAGDAFDALLAQTRWQDAPADVRLLCIHQAVEGACVGVQDFTFRRGRDVIEGSALPSGFAAVLSGHIHRRQVLTHDLSGRPLAAPVLYPGSVERTSFAERREEKGYLILRFAPGPTGGALDRWTFVRLPARPMVVLKAPRDTAVGSPRGARAVAHRDTDRMRRRLAALDPHAVVRVEPGDAAWTAARLRALAPPTMNLDVRFPVAARRS